MTDILVEVVKIPPLKQIKDADRIAVATIGGYDVIVRKEDFNEGDLGVFISVDSVVPKDLLDFYNLDIKNGRIRTKKLKGVYSQGLLIPMTAPIFSNILGQRKEGENLKDALGIVKYLPPSIKGHGIAGGGIKRPWVDPRMIVYDIENIQNIHNRAVFKEGDSVVITEKIHGMHGAACWINGKFYYTSRKVNLEIPREDKTGDNIWWRMVQKYKLDEIAKELSQSYNLDSDVIIRYEIFGKDVQELDYGLQDQQIVIFDIEKGFNNFVPHHELSILCEDYKLPTVPTLYEGPFSFKKAEELANMDSVISKKKPQYSEGIVIKDIDEGKTSSNKLYMSARKILKQINKRYLLKGKEELNTDE